MTWISHLIHLISLLYVDKLSILLLISVMDEFLVALTTSSTVELEHIDQIYSTNCSTVPSARFILLLNLFVIVANSKCRRPESLVDIGRSADPY